MGKAIRSHAEAFTVLCERREDGGEGPDRPTSDGQDGLGIGWRVQGGATSIIYMAETVHQ